MVQGHLLSQQVNKGAGFIEHIMAVYKDINSLPIEEILEAIDLTIEALETLTQEERFSDRKSIFKKTWWAKTIGILLIILKVIHHYHYYY
jgi:uncharacterized membrane protein